MGNTNGWDEFNEMDFDPEEERERLRKTIQNAQAIIKEAVLTAESSDRDKARDTIVSKIMDLTMAIGMLAAAYYPDEAAEVFGTTMGKHITDCINNTKEALKNAQAADRAGRKPSAWE